MICPCCRVDLPASTSFINVTRLSDLENFSVCATCYRMDTNWEQDYGDSSVMRFMGNPREIRYDGSSDVEDDDPQSFFVQAPGHGTSDTFECQHCGGALYGDSDYISDVEEPWCRLCTNNYAVVGWNGEFYADVMNIPARVVAGVTPTPAILNIFDEPSSTAPGRVNPMGYPIFMGEACERYLAAPTVGIEFEHAPVQLKAQSTVSDKLYLHISEAYYDPHIRWRDLFKIHGDGSIAYMEDHGSAEIISMPASGVILEAVINRFYEPFADGRFTPGPEHHTCGFHMHVGSKLLEYIDRTGDVDGLSTANFKLKSRTLLQDMITICSEFVSSSRRQSKFCIAKAGMRGNGEGTVGANIMSSVFGVGSYPAIAVRSIATLEYRLWPSSNSIKNTKARAELSQKLTSLFDDALFASGAYGVDQAKIDMIQEVVAMCVGGTRINIPAKLKTLLSLSDATTESLQRLSERFNPYSGKKTHFHFSEYQIRCIKSEKSEDACDFVAPDGERVSHVGDTTAHVASAPSKSGFGSYLTFGECIKCYPASTEGDMPRLVAALAKGEQ